MYPCLCSTIFNLQIVTHILKYLSFDDRRQIALVNPTWYYASIHPIFIRKELFVYEDTDLMTKFLDFQQMLMNSKREVFNLKFYNFTSYLEPDSIFWNKLNSRITSLHLVNLVEFNDLFLDCLTNMNNLETLELRNIREFTTTVKIRNALLKLHSLSLFNIYFISDKEFNNILQYAPHLKELCFNDCNILCWGQSIKRFYPNYKISGGLINYDSPYIFTDVNIINNLKNIKNIEHLMLQNCCKIFMQLPVETKLKSLVLSVVDEAHNLEKFNLTLAIHSMSLQQLDISHIPCCSLFALTKLHNLKVLKVLYTTDFNSMCGDSKACLNKFSESLSCLKNISSLTIVPMLTFDFSIITIPNCVLSSLNILDCAIENCHKLVDVGTNLISLTIQNGNILTASDLQYLFGNHTNLRHLLINKCINFNDDILMKSPPSVNLKGKQINNVV